MSKPNPFNACQITCLSHTIVKVQALFIFKFPSNTLKQSNEKKETRSKCQLI